MSTSTSIRLRRNVSVGLIMAALPLKLRIFYLLRPDRA
jgi:hypothetical protein